MKKDLRVLNAILRKMCKENGVDINNVRISKYGYIEEVDPSLKSIVFCRTNYKGVDYEVRFVDGCFAPFILPVDGKLHF